MATRRGSPKARAGGTRAGKANGKKRDDVVLGIDAKAYARKESEIAQLEVKVKKLRAKIKPDQVLIAEHRKAITELTGDIEDETEERDVKVKNEYHFKTSEVRVLRADDLKEIDRRTMTVEELKRNTDIEDRKLKAPTNKGPAVADDVVEDDAEGGTEEADPTV